MEKMISVSNFRFTAKGIIKYKIKAINKVGRKPDRNLVVAFSNIFFIIYQLLKTKYDNTIVSN